MTPEQFAVRRRDLSEHVKRALVLLFTGLDSWRDEDQARFLEQAIPIIRGGQSALASLVAAWVAQLAGDAAGYRIAPPSIPATAAVNLRNGVDDTDVYVRPFVEIYTLLSKGASLTEAVTSGELRLREITEMDLQQTYSYASRAALEELPEDARPRFWRRVLNSPENCAMCVLASTQRYRIQKLKPIHPGCVPEGTRVRADGVSVMTRRRYTGELTVITTAAGDEVTVTPNHPVLTDSGWVPGGDVREGHHLVHSGLVDGKVGDRPDERHRPALVEDVWRACSVAGVVTVPMAAEDFHGDGSNGEVDVVCTDSNFPSEWDSPILEASFEEGLVDRRGWRVEFAGARILASLFPGGPSSSAPFVGGMELRESFVRGHLCGAHQSSLRSVSDFASILDENGPKGSPADVTFPGEGVLRFSAVVAGDQVFDLVTEVRRVPFSGHVYNFQTEEGIYEADNHIVHNCDCTVGPIFGDDPGQVIDEKTLEKVHAAVEELTGTSDAGGRAPDYRKILTTITADHGELGELLVRPGDHFTDSSGLSS
ncbi:hypothetical protein [Amycolatopsis japonica]